VATRARTWWLLAGGIVVAVLLVAVVAPWVYIQFIKADPAPKLTLSETTTTAPTGSAAPSVPLAGTWNVVDGSKGQYRVEEVLFGQDATATGTTEDVTGAVVFDQSSVQEATVIVDLTTVKSGESRRDAQFHGRIMNTAEFPDATFTLTQPIALPANIAEGTPVTVTATGELTVHGMTQSVTVELDAQRTGNAIEVAGEIPVKFADYGIDDPSGGPATVKDNGLIEFLVVLNPA
jgi:polyisoprenoid-binding protein YceI